MRIKYNKRTVNLILIIVALLIVTNGLNYWQTDRKYQQTIQQNVEAMRGLQALSDSMTTQYDLITTDIELALQDRTKLREHVEYIETNYDIDVTEVSELIALRDSIDTKGQSFVVPKDEHSGVMFINADTLGVYLDAEVLYPEGRYKLDVGFKPLDLVVTVERTDEGLKRHTAYFPNQPWYTISSWDVIVEEGDSGPPSLIERLFGDIGDIGFAFGGGIGVTPTGMALVSIGDTFIGIDSHQNVVLMRKFSLFN